MRVISVTRNLKDGTPVLRDNVELGKEYEVIGYDSKMIMGNHDTGQFIMLEAYYLQSDDNEVGFLPCELFQPINDGLKES